MKFLGPFPPMFDENQRMADDTGGALHLEANQAIRPVFKKWIDAGYGPREISHIIMLAVFENELGAVLDLPVSKTPKKPEPPKLKLAVDVAVSNKACRFLANHGFKVEVRAEASEPDSEWLGRAKQADCDMVISNDNQVLFDAKEMGMMTISADDPGSRGTYLYEAIVAALDQIPSPPFPNETSAAESARTEV